MKLAIEQLKQSIQAKTRAVADCRSARDVNQRQIDELNAQIATHEATIHECNAALEALQRPAPAPAAAKEKVSEAPKPDPEAPKPRRGKPDALTSKG